jgi:hypothetical protein
LRAVALTGVLQGGTTTVRVWLAGSTTARALTGAIVRPCSCSSFRRLPPLLLSAGSNHCQRSLKFPTPDH